MVFCEAHAPVHEAGVCAPLQLVSFVHAHTPVHAWSQHWSACAVSGLLLPTCAWIPRVCCGAILRLSSFWIVPSLPFPIFPLYILYQCDGCPSSLLRGGSWLGCQDLPAMGAVSSRSWLPIVEAPGCLGHPTCI